MCEFIFIWLFHDALLTAEII